MASASKLREPQSDSNIEPYRKAADESDWCGFLELMAENPVKVEQIYNDKLGRYDEPIGNQILGVSLDGITYVTRLHEWIIEYRPGSAQDRDQFPALEDLSIGRPLSSPIDISPRAIFQISHSERSSPWSSVNNCTLNRSNIDDHEKYVINNLILCNRSI